MKSLPYARTAALLLAALCSGAALAQKSTPLVLTDVAPLPAEERGSLGAVIMTDQPVLAQREMMNNLAASRLNTSVMGGPPVPARVLRGKRARDELLIERAREATRLQRDGARSLDEK